MKSLIAISALSLALAGCAVPGAAPQETVTITQEAPRAAEPERAASPDDLYMELLASEGIRASRETSIETGRLICDALDAGYEKAFLAEMAMDSGFSMREAAAIVAAAVVVYCPRHEI